MLSSKKYKAVRKEHFGDDGATANAKWKEYRAFKIAQGWYQRTVPGPCGDMTKWVKEDMFNIGTCDNYYDKMLQLAPLSTGNPPTPTAYPYGCGAKVCAPQAKESNMAYGKTNDIQISMDVNTTAQNTDGAKAQRYLSDRLYEIKYAKTRPLSEQFNLHVDNTPKNFKELIDAIKNDKFKIDPKAEKKLERCLADQAETDPDFDDCDSDWYFANTYGIIWDGPQPDRKGYEATNKAIASEYQKALDIINVMPADKGLEALQAFEAWTPTAATATAQ